MEEDKRVVEYLEDADRRARRPNKIKHKDVFPAKQKSNIKDINKMNDIRKHGFTEEQLKGMKLPQLKKIVKEHNLHNSINSNNSHHNNDNNNNDNGEMNDISLQPTTCNQHCATNTQHLTPIINL